jgi:transcriptional regulator GlxA family with amidase domain
VTVPKGGRSRHLPLTQRLASALKASRHLRSARVLCLPDGTPITRDRHVTTQQLSVQFRAEFGVSLPQYKRMVRVARALRHVGTQIEAITAEVGYRSKKDFYRSFHAVTGLTPAAFRKLPTDAAETLVDKVWANLEFPRKRA